MRKPIKNLFWPIFNERHRVELELFMKLTIVAGRPWGEVLMALVREWNAWFIRENDLSRRTLVYEANLLALLAGNGARVTRRTLYLHRDSGKLNGGDRRLFWTEGRRVVYDLSGCQSYFKYRRKLAA